MRDKNNGDIFREKVSKMTNKEIAKRFICSEIMYVVNGRVDDCKGCIADFDNKEVDCEDGKLAYLNKEPNIKLYYIHRFSTKENKEMYIVHFEDATHWWWTGEEDKKVMYDYETACKIRNILNEKRENKLNLWLIKRVKE